MERLRNSVRASGASLEPHKWELGTKEEDVNGYRISVHGESEISVLRRQKSEKPRIAAFPFGAIFQLVSIQ